MADTTPTASRTALHRSGVPLANPIATNSRRGSARTTLAVLQTIARFGVSDRFDAHDVQREMAKLPDSCPIRGLHVETIAAALLRIAAEEPSCIQPVTFPHRGMPTKFMRSFDAKALDAARTTIAGTKPGPAPAPTPEPGTGNPVVDLACLAFDVHAIREEQRTMAAKLQRVLDELGVQA